jgi:hypothetical protein
MKPEELGHIVPEEETDSLGRRVVFTANGVRAVFVCKKEAAALIIIIIIIIIIILVIIFLGCKVNARI